MNALTGFWPNLPIDMAAEEKGRLFLAAYWGAVTRGRPFLFSGGRRESSTVGADRHGQRKTRTCANCDAWVDWGVLCSDCVRAFAGGLATAAAVWLGRALFVLAMVAATSCGALQGGTVSFTPPTQIALWNVDVVACATLDPCVGIPGARIGLHQGPGATDGDYVWLTANQDGYVVFPVLPSLVESDTIIRADGYLETRAHIDVAGTHDGQRHNLVLVPAVPAAPIARRGLVRFDRRVWVDDDGAWRPFGATVLWAVWGWQHDRARLQQNLTWARDQGVDYVRILGDVGWSGEAIDSSAPGYAASLAELIDWDYAQGLRTLVTVWGGSARDPIKAATIVADVVRPRAAKVLYLEASNESYNNGPDDATLLRMVAILRTAGVQVVASAPLPGNLAVIPRWIAGGATAAAVHLDRTYGDLGWRAVRQPYDVKDFAVATDHNEPIGPRSSVTEMTDGLQLAMLRATGILEGAGAFVFHNGAGVFGRVDAAHNRPANLWEVPGAAAAMALVKRVDRYLPAGVENWPKTSQHGGTQAIGDHPLLADAIWSDGADHGVNRAYGAVSGTQWAELLLGVKGRVTLTARWALAGTATNVATGAQIQIALAAGGTVTLPGAPDAHVGYILSGVRR